MVEECVERDSPAEYIACHEVEREGPRALGGLRVGSLYAAYQAGIVGIGEVEIERVRAVFGISGIFWESGALQKGLCILDSMRDVYSMNCLGRQNSVDDGTSQLTMVR